MAFVLQSFALSSVSMNSPVVTLENSSVVGANVIYTYQSAADAQATIAASGYFNAVSYQLQVGDVIYCVGTDSNVWYSVTTNALGVVTVSSFSLAGPVGTANISDNAVTYAKFQEVAADSLVGNPTGSLANAEGITLGNGLVFSGTTLALASNGLQVATGTLTVANWTGMYAAPVQILAATVAGAGNMIVVDKFVVNYVYGTAAFAAGGNVFLQYGNTADAGGVAATAALAPAGFSDQTHNTVIGVGGALAATATSGTIDTAVYISNASTAFTGGGTSSFTYYLTYKVVAVS